LLLHALWRVQAIDPGFRTDSVLTIQTWLPMPRYALASTRRAFYTEVLSGVRSLPGVSKAACISSLPMVPGGGIWPVTGTGNELSERDASGTKTVAMRLVSSSYFDTMGIPMRAGRDISESDTLDSSLVAVVSESFASRYWPNQDPIGREFHFAFDNFPFAQQDRVVVGVVGDVRFRGLERQSEPQVYLSYKQLPDRVASFYSPREFVVRSTEDTTVLAPSIRRVIQKADRELPISAVRPLKDVVDLQTASRSSQMRLVATFAGLALLLAGTGIYGLLSFTVGQRSKEFGLRLALGADSRDIRSMVLREGSTLAGIGAIFGLVLSYVAGRSMEALLAGVGALDPATIAAAAVVAFAMTLSGSIVPLYAPCGRTRRP
jgi:predicted permease